MIPPFVPGETAPDYHAVTTITLGELLAPGGIDWTTPQWSWRDDAYNDTQYSRCCKKIENRYYDRELGVMPPGRWRRHLLRLIAEIMPVLKPLYELADGNPGIFMTDNDTWHKTRTVFSDFPATQLATGQDYASNATDTEYETVTNGNYMDKVKAIRQGDYVDIDVLLLEHLEECFSPLWTVSMNNY
jgi:hypothetical protein